MKAYVVPRPGTWLVADQVKDHCAERLAAYRVPKLVEVREELPRSIIGKPLRRVLRGEHIAAITTTSTAMTSDGLPGLPC